MVYTIDKFDGEFSFLSNFYESPVKYKGNTFGSAEAAFQAQKCQDTSLIKSFCGLSPSESKRKGRHVTLRKDWEKVKDGIMYDIVLSKFSQNETLKHKLLSTGSEELLEGNRWKDTYWGVCNGVGENKLGHILMEVREKLFQSGWQKVCLCDII